MSKHSRIFTRLSFRLSCFYDAFPKLQKKIIEKNTPPNYDYVIQLHSYETNIGFYFHTLDEDRKPLPIEEQYLRLKVAHTDDKGNDLFFESEKYDINEFKDISEKFANTNTDSKFVCSRIFRGDSELDPATFSIINLLEVFFDFKFENEVFSLMNDFKNELFELNIQNFESYDLKETEQNALEAFELEYKELSQMSEIKILEAKLARMKREEEELKKELTQKHRVKYHKDVSVGKSKQYGQRRTALLNKMVKHSVENRYYVPYQNIVDLLAN